MSECFSVLDRSVNVILIFEQELEPEAGEKLCRSFPRDPKVDLTAIAQKARHSLKKRGLSIEMSKDRQVIVNPARSRLASPWGIEGFNE